MTVRLIRIGNSRGTRLPHELLRRYRLQEGAELQIEERRTGLLVRIEHRGTGQSPWRMRIVRWPPTPRSGKNGLIGMPRWGTAVKVERYAVHRVDLDSKTRPAVIVSDDAMNTHLGTVVVCPITSRLHPRWPVRVQTRVTGKAAEIASIRSLRSHDFASDRGSVSCSPHPRLPFATS